MWCINWRSEDLWIMFHNKHPNRIQTLSAKLWNNTYLRLLECWEVHVSTTHSCNWGWAQAIPYLCNVPIKKKEITWQRKAVTYLSLWQANLYFTISQFCFIDMFNVAFFFLTTMYFFTMCYCEIINPKHAQ